MFFKTNLIILLLVNVNLIASKQFNVSTSDELKKALKKVILLMFN